MQYSRTAWVLFTVLPFVLAEFQVLQTGLLANESSVFLSDGCTAALESSISCDQWLQDNANEGELTAERLLPYLARLTQHFAQMDIAP